MGVSSLLSINLAVSQIIEPDWVWAAAHRNKCNRAFAQRPKTFKKFFTKPNQA